jgi:hypothetical protein
MNASGEKNTDGTHIIIWTHTNKNAPNHAEFRFIKGAKPLIEADLSCEI